MRFSTKMFWLFTLVNALAWWLHFAAKYVIPLWVIDHL